MNFLKRAFLSLKHKAANNILLIILFIVLSTLILCGLSIHAASISACASLRRALGGSVQIVNNKPADGITVEQAKRIGGIKYVKSSNFLCSADAYAVDFKADSNESKGTKIANVNAYGVTMMKDIDAFEQGEYKISDGRLLTADDVGKNNAVISRDLAVLNNLKVGSKITVGNINNGNEKQFTVIGIYANADTGDTGSSLGENAETIIFVPYTASLALSGKNIIYAAKYEITDPVNIDAFKTEVSKMYPGKYSLDAHDGDYQRMSSSLMSVTSIADILLYISIIASAAILFLIVLLTFKSRNFEIGVLLSIGEKKSRIILQMALEILVPVLIAFSLSAATGNLTAHQIGKMMFDVQGKTSSSYQNDSEDLNGSSQNKSSGNKTAAALNDVINIDVKVNANQYLALYLAGILISLLAACVPVVTVMRFSPGKIFSQLE